MVASSILFVCLTLTLVTVTCGQGVTNSRADRISQAISASDDATSAAVSGGSVRGATAKGKDFAVLATRQNTKASDFGRRLQQGATNVRSDRISQAISASEDAISAAAAGGNVRAATTKARAYAVLATRENTKASDFGRKLQQGVTNSRADRISQAISASEDAISAAVAGGSVRGATGKAKDFAVLATRQNTKASDFGRRLQQAGRGATNVRSDRISQAISASEDAISAAAAGSSVRAATTKARAYAVLATRENTKASDFGRKMLSGATNNRSDRIAQALSASAESIGAAVSGRSDATTAAQKSKAFARMAARDGTAASEFGGK